MGLVDSYKLTVGDPIKQNLEYLKVLQSDSQVARCLSLVNQYDCLTYIHSVKVFDYAMKMGSYLNLEKADMERLARSASLHDVGKVIIPKNIISKPAKLTDAERNVMKLHVLYGCIILAQEGIGTRVVQEVSQHHEKLDASGYPFKHQGIEIRLNSRIITIADMFDALTSDRPYRKAMSKDEALGLIYDTAGVDRELLGVLSRIV